ncbi:DUF4148 domain-containing protein [Paraburkholderia kururiensis]|uniref:DUF4148 domain-containing protein n=1 Tax=Paraburkholderia kururiensis TaxID=984307 RepID=UPI0005A86F06|nr:DUF4148 domain-containing protein [Paraburkholderia kururiensis]
MKTLLIAATFVGLASATSAFAQSTPSASASSPATAATPVTQVAQNNAATPAQGGWVPPYGQPVMQKTRAQVYQELVEAEKDGQLAYLNSTIYAH